jgi:hypothetical protein
MLALALAAVMVDQNRAGRRVPQAGTGKWMRTGRGWGHSPIDP